MKSPLNPIAEELNRTIESGNPHLMEMLSGVGKALFFPKGILSQGAEAKEKAHRYNATIGIATEGGDTMYLPSVMAPIAGLAAREALTYAPSFGLPALRKAWQASLYRKNRSLAGRSVSLPVVTSGITHAIAVFADLWLDPGDLVLLPDMMWGNYSMIFSVRKGAALSYWPIFRENGAFNLEGFERRVQEEGEKGGKLAVVLNFPHNPSGYTVTEAEADRIVAALAASAERGVNTLAVFDDSYFGLFFEPDTVKESLFARCCGRHPRLLAVKLDGCTKENFAWGLRVGFITYGAGVEGDPAAVWEALEKKTAGCVRGMVSNASHLSQSILLRAMEQPAYPSEKQEKFEILKRRANRVKAILSHPKYADAWDVYPFNSGYFMCLRLKSVDAERLRVHLLDRYGVGTISIGQKNLRIAFSCVDEDHLEELFELIHRGVKDLS